MRWTDEQCELLKKLWADGLSSTHIAKQLGVARGAITGKLARLGVPRLSHGQICERNRIAQQARFRADTAKPILPAHKPAPPPKPARVKPQDPSALVVEALLAQARAAERRREGYRAERVR
jgi:hypothetical protein